MRRLLAASRVGDTSRIMTSHRPNGWQQGDSFDLSLVSDSFWRLPRGQLPGFDTCSAPGQRPAGCRACRAIRTAASARRYRLPISPADAPGRHAVQLTNNGKDAEFRPIRQYPDTYPAPADAGVEQVIFTTCSRNRGGGWAGGWMTKTKDYTQCPSFPRSASLAGPEAILL